MLFLVVGLAAFLNSAQGDETAPGAANPKNVPTIFGGVIAQPFKDIAPDQGFLVGLELGVVKRGSDEFIKTVHPIYRVGNKEQFGKQCGAQPVRLTTIKAKAGYVVGAINCRFGNNFDGCSLLFMRFEDGKLEPRDCYESDWVGYVGKKTVSTIGGYGSPAVGIAGRGSDSEVNGLGLVFQGQEGFGLNDISGISASSILGTAANPEFKDVAPEGGLLVGFEIALG